MYGLGLCVLIVNTVIVWQIKRDIWFPGVIAGILWTFVYFLLFSTNLYVDYSNFIYLYISICVVTFEWISVGTSYIKIKGEKTRGECTKNVNYKHIDMTLGLLMIILISYIAKVAFIVIRRYAGIQAIVFTLKYAQITGDLSTGLVPYAATFSFVFTSFLVYANFNSEKKYKYYLKNRMIFSLGLSAFYAITLMGRVFVLQFVISSLGIFVFTSHLKKEQLKKKVITIGLVVLTFLFAYGISKFFYRMEEMTIREIIDDTISVYVAGPLVGMQILLKRGVNPQNTKATFQFFYSLLNALGCDFQQYNRVSYLALGPTKSLYGNVFTAFYYWIIDFGYWGAFYIYQVIAIIHTRMYSNARKKKNGFNYTLVSFAMYPLLMQFFDEQYLTQISWMIQVYIWASLIYKTNFYVRKERVACLK